MKTVKEFEQANADVLIRRMTEEDFQNLTDGCVLFCVTVAKSDRPVDERKIRSVSYQMVGNHIPGDTVRVAWIRTLALTEGGRAKIEAISAEDAGAHGTKVLYECKPLPYNDHRRGHNWHIY